MDMEGASARPAPVRREFRRRFDPSLPVEQRVVSGEEISTACRQAHHVDVHHAIIRGPIVLRDERIAATIRLVDCVVGDPLDWAYTHLDSPVHIERCEVLLGARFDGAVFASDLYLSRTRFSRPSKLPSVSGTEPTSTLVSFDDARFFGLLAGDGLETAENIALTFARARIAGDIFLRGAVLRGPVTFARLEGEGSLYLDGSVCHARALLTSTKFSGSVLCRSLRWAAGLDATELHVGGSFDLSHSELEGGSLHLSQVRVGTDLLAEGLVGDGAVSLVYATVAGHLSLSESSIKRIAAEGLSVQGRARLKSTRVAEVIDLTASRTGEVVLVDTECMELRLERAHVAGGVQAGRARFRSKEQSVDLRSLRVDEALDLDGVEVAGNVNGGGLVVGTDLTLTGARVHGNAELHRVSIGGDLSARGAEFDGAVRLVRGSIDGQIVLPGASFRERVTFARSELGTLILSGEQGEDERGSVMPWPPPRFEHGIDLRDVHVHGAVLMIGVMAGRRDLKREHDAFSIDLAGASVDGELVLRHVSVTDPIRLERVKVAGPVRTEGNVGVIRAGSAEYGSGFEVRSTGRSSPKGTLDLDLSHSRVDGTVDLSGLVDRQDVVLSLRSSVARRLVFPEGDQGQGSVDLIGFESPGPPIHWRWLIGQRVSLVGGNRAYEEIAEKLRGDAQPSAARRLERAAGRALRRRLRENGEHIAFVKATVRWLLAGDGAIPSVAMLLAAVAIVGASGVFGMYGAVLYRGTTEVADLSTLAAVGVAVDRFLPFDTALGEGLTTAKVPVGSVPVSPAWCAFGLQVLGWLVAVYLVSRLFRRG